jgi:ADP-ribose pyrophosphatase
LGWRHHERSLISRKRRSNPKRVFDGVLLHIRRDTVRLPDGSLAQREFVVHPARHWSCPVLPDGTSSRCGSSAIRWAAWFSNFPAGRSIPREIGADDRASRAH